MKFRMLLEFLQIVFDERTFSSNDARHLLQNPEVLEKMVSVDQYLRSTRPKIISKDLDRLYRMGFLSRRHVKRQLRTRNNKACNKGFEYRYCLNKQGHSYVKNFLWNISAKERLRGKFQTHLDDLAMQEWIRHYASSPESEKLILHGYQMMFMDQIRRPIDLRFPIKHEPFVEMMLSRIIIERDRYKEQVRKLQEELQLHKTKMTSGTI